MIIGLCVGNGLSIDLQKTYHKELSRFDTYNFFDWNIKSPISDNFFLDELPYLKDRLKYRAEQRKDFELVESIISECQSSPELFGKSMLLCELRHYIAHAFSEYQKIIDGINVSQWHWTKWLDIHRDNLGFLVSLNYDRVIENALETINLKYRRIGPENEKEGICILKPHGSIDFDVAPYCIRLPLSYPLKNAVYSNDVSIISLEKKQWNSVRTEVDIVLPNEYSTQLHYQWVKPGYDVIKNQGYLFTHFIFAGISYCKQDRDEINFILRSLNRDTKIIIVNPEPSREFIELLDSKFLSVDVWKTELKNLK